MALTHAQSTELIDVRPFATNLAREATRTLVKTDTLEIVRLVMRAGKVYEGHRVPGEITVQCLEGRCTFTAAGATRDLEPGHLVYLAGGEEHSLRALQDCSLLLTILLVAQGFRSLDRACCKLRTRCTNMDIPYTFFQDLAREAAPPADGILSRTLYQDDRIKVVIFGFGPGQELSEHTASMPALVKIISGEATLVLGGESHEAQPGTWAHMPADLKHSVRTETAVVMLLILLKRGGAQ